MAKVPGRVVASSSMPKTPKPADDVSRALRLLDDAPDTEAVMVMVHGFSPELLAELIDAGLVTARREHVDRGRPIEVVRLRITDAGRARSRAGRTGQ